MTALSSPQNSSSLKLECQLATFLDLIQKEVRGQLSKDAGSVDSSGARETTDQMPLKSGEPRSIDWISVEVFSDPNLWLSLPPGRQCYVHFGGPLSHGDW